MTTNEAGRDAERLRVALVEFFDRMWLRHAHRRDLAFFKNVEPDFEKWLKTLDSEVKNPELSAVLKGN